MVEKISPREEMALSPERFAVNMLYHRYGGKKLTDKQKQCAFDLLHSMDKELLSAFSNDLFSQEISLF